MNINLSTLHMVSVNQLVTLKAKVVNLQPATTMEIRRTKLMKAEAQLVDPHGLVKIVFCEDDIKKVKDGATYVFRNLRVK